MANLEAWVVEGREPPSSQVPSFESETVARREQVLGCVAGIPGAAVPELSLIGKAAVPAVDADGNDLPGVRLPELQVPLATSAGWNVRHAENGGAGQISDMVGATIPFAPTAAARKASGDPRPSLEERYGDVATYQAKVRAAAESLAAERLMLAADIDRSVANAGVLWERVMEG